MEYGFRPAEQLGEMYSKFLYLRSPETEADVISFAEKSGEKSAEDIENTLNKFKRATVDLQNVSLNHMPFAHHFCKLCWSESSHRGEK